MGEKAEGRPSPGCLILFLIFFSQCRRVAMHCRVALPHFALTIEQDTDLISQAWRTYLKDTKQISDTPLSMYLCIYRRVSKQGALVTFQRSCARHVQKLTINVSSYHMPYYMLNRMSDDTLSH